MLGFVLGPGVPSKGCPHGLLKGRFRVGAV